MKTPDDNELDRRFRESLNNPEGNAEFREDDWTAMEKLLDEKPQQRNRIFWLYWLSGSVAALLLLFFGWTLLKPVIDTKSNRFNTKIIHKTKNTKTNNADQREDSINVSDKNSIKTNQLAINKTNIYRGKNSISRKKQTTPLSDNRHEKPLISALDKASFKRKKTTNNLIDETAENLLTESKSAKKPTNLLLSKNENTTAKTQIYSDKRSISRNDKEFTALEAQNRFAGNTLNLVVTPVAKNLVADRKMIAQTAKPLKVKLNIPPRFSLAILSAPDLNGVSSFTGIKVGTNAGLQLSVQLTRKFSITTGAVYAAKPYEINAEQYASVPTYRGKQGEVAVDCKVLDIPINLNYLLISKNRNSFSAGAGLSSYFMLKENYNFYYADNTSYTYNIANQNKHILGVLNLNATYQRQVNTKFSLMLQPYLKLPLTPIGYERINLQSAGIAVGVGWNISSLKNR